MDSNPKSKKPALVKALQKGHLEKLFNTEEGKKEFRFSCTGCGNCCDGEGRVYFTDKELWKIYKFLGLKGKEKGDLYKRLIQKRDGAYHTHDGAGPCYFLDSNRRCSIYPVRPLQCRAFPFWPSVFSSQTALDENRSLCRGMQRKDAKSFSIEEIREKVKETHEKFLEPQRGQGIKL